MNEPLQFLRDGFGDQSIVSLQEWVGPNGKMGVYESKKHGYVHLFILIDAEKRIYYHHQYDRAFPIPIVLKDAEVIATFAGAQEEEIEHGSITQ